MPTSPPLESIAKNILRSCPKISLRESDAVEYGDEVFLLAKRVLQTQINKTFTTSAVDGGNANNKTSKKSGDKVNSVLSDFELSRRSTSNEMVIILSDFQKRIKNFCINNIYCICRKYSGIFAIKRQYLTTTLTILMS